MNYSVISNMVHTSNHAMILRDRFKKSDDILVASPFLMQDFSDFLSEIDLSNIDSIHLITRLIPKSVEQIKTINSIISLIEFLPIINNTTRCEISLNNKLHGKVYIFKQKGEYLSAIISSANFTTNGLSRNHEWGVEITDQLEIAELEKSILKSVEVKNIPDELLHDMLKLADDFEERQRQTWEPGEVELDLTKLLPSPRLSTTLDDVRNYWLKPIGDTTRPVDKERLFMDPEGKFGFARRPTGVKLRDILIIYAVGSGRIISVYEVISAPEYAKEEEIKKDSRVGRWPWSIRGRNLTPNFGNNWWENNFHVNALKDGYLSSEPDKSITAVGGKTLGALNYGSDKLRLSPDFARFIINRIMEANSRK